MTTSNQNEANIQNTKNNSVTSNTGAQLSIVSVQCRICYDNEKEEELITPCLCKGTVAFVHRSCLETWLGESNTTTCELCHQVFKTERTPKYSTCKSVWQWCRCAPNNMAQSVKSDIAACTIITPLAIVITYVCLFSSEYYNQKRFVNIPAARWTSVSLLLMIGIMLVGYYMWVYSVIRMHARMWYNWWQRTCDVHYIAPSTVIINVPEAPTIPTTIAPLNTSSTNLAVPVQRHESVCTIIPITDDRPEEIIISNVYAQACSLVPQNTIVPVHEGDSNFTFNSIVDNVSQQDKSVAGRSSRIHEGDITNTSNVEQNSTDSIV